MSADRLSGRYAKSILDLAIEKGKLEVIYDDMLLLKRIIKSNRDFYVMLKSPVINPDKKIKILDTILQGRVDEMTLKFTVILSNKKREIYLPEVVDAFIRQYNTFNKITPVEVTTATPLDEEVQAIITKDLRKKFNLDKVEIVSKVDPSIIGGFIMKFDSKLYDASIKSSLDTLKTQFSQNKYIKQI